MLMKAAFSCVVDDNPKYARQAALWAASLLIHGDQSAESLVVHTVGEGEPRLRALLRSWGVNVVQIEAFDARHPHSNKLAQFATATLQDADCVVLCDCDLAFAASISPWVRGDRIRARIADRPWLSPARWRTIFAAADLRFPMDRVLAGNGVPTLPTFCNGGLYIIPRALFTQIGTTWSKWDRWLLDRLELITPLQIFADQISFTLACEELSLTINYLPIDLNYHIGQSREHVLKRDARRGWTPRVLHYHNKVGPRGFLHNEKIASMNAATERINELIRCLNELYPLDQPQNFTVARAAARSSR
jgi:hypothetical protein